jgi:hypothetical protein
LDYLTKKSKILNTNKMKRQAQLVNAIQKLQARSKAVGGTRNNLPTKVSDTTMYLVHRVDGNASIIELTDEQTKKEVGVTNFDGNKLAKGRNFVMDEMKVTLAKDGLVAKNVDWKGKKVTLIPELANAELKISQGENMLLSISVSDLSLSNDDDDFRTIGSTPVFGEETPIKWVLTYPNGVAVPAETTDGLFLKIECRGFQSIQ